MPPPPPSAPLVARATDYDTRGLSATSGPDRLVLASTRVIVMIVDYLVENSGSTMTTSPSLAGKRALVTGGAGGIGAAIVRRLASHGVSVAVNYHSDRSAADELVAEIRDNGGTAAALPADVSDRD